MENYNLELQKAAEEIKRNYARLVCIQLPDGLKPKAKEIQEYLEKNKLRHQLYDKNNKDKVNANNAKKRARRRQALPIWLTKNQLLEIKSFYTKAQDLTLKTGIEHNVDHIIPLKGNNVCGLHVPWNLQVITASENVRKSNNY